MTKKKLIRYMSYGLTKDFETCVKDFCARLWGYRARIERIEVLDSKEFDKINKKPNPKAIAQTFPYERKDGVTVQMIQLRETEKGWYLHSLFHEILHVYRPEASEEDVLACGQWLTIAFKVWQKLYNDETLREYFIELFRKDFLNEKELEIWEPLEGEIIDTS